jgi:hypothetical protein
VIDLVTVLVTVQVTVQVVAARLARLRVGVVAVPDLRRAPRAVAAPVGVVARRVRVHRRRAAAHPSVERALSER